MLIDTHAHLNWDSYKEDFDQMIDRSVEAGVGLVINIGTNLTTNQEVIDLSSDKIPFYSTIGLHPHDAIGINIEALEKMYQDNPKKVVAIGECGLDFFFHGNSDFVETDKSIEELKEVQKQSYKAQAALAKKLELPLVIHCRDAWDQIFIPELEGTRGTFHTFTGTAEDAQKAMALGYYLSFSCIITYPKNEPLRQILKDLPLDRILTETDCPFLPPQAIRGQRNEPAHVQEVVKVIAEVKGLSTEEVKQAVEANTRSLFAI